MSVDSCLVQKLSNYIDLNDAQKNLLVQMEEVSRDLRPGESIDFGNDGKRDKLFVVSAGWMLLTQDLETSDTAVSRIYLPGDVIGLDSICVNFKEERVIAAGEATICPFPESGLAEIFLKDPQLSSLFFYVSGRDSLISRALATATILLQAHERVAFFLLLLLTRLQELNAVESDGFVLRMSQQEIGSAIALSQHQVNRSLRELREQGFIETNGKQFKILDIPRLEKFCHFKPEHYKISIKSAIFNKN